MGVQMKSEHLSQVDIYTDTHTYSRVCDCEARVEAHCRRSVALCSGNGNRVGNYRNFEMQELKTIHI